MVADTLAGGLAVSILRRSSVAYGNSENSVGEGGGEKMIPGFRRGIVGRRCPDLQAGAAGFTHIDIAAGCCGEEHFG